jgi:hypothetical protein
MPTDLRPLTLGELLDRSFGLYRRHFWLFVGIMGLPSLFALGFGLLVNVFGPSRNPQPITPGTPPAEVVGAMIWFVAAVIVMGIVYFIAYAVGLGATTVAVSQLYMDRPVSIRGAYEPLKGKVGRLTLLMLLISMRLFAVFLLCFSVLFVGFLIVGVLAALGGVAASLIGALVVMLVFLGSFILCGWIGLRYAVAVPAAVLEDQAATQAIRRSIALTQGSMWRVFALVVFTMIITYAVLLIFQGPFVFLALRAGPEAQLFFWTNLFGTISGAVGGALTGPLMIVAFAVLYYDLRVRKEGLDIELLLAGLDKGDRTDVGAPSSALI